MARPDRRRRVARRRPTDEVVEEVVPEVSADEVEEEIVDDESAAFLKEISGADDDDDDGGGYVEAPTRRRAKTPVADGNGAKQPRVQAVPIAVDDKLPDLPEIEFSVASLVEALAAGHEFTIKSLGGGMYKIAAHMPEVRSLVVADEDVPGRLPPGFYENLYTQKYIDWKIDWSKMTYEEKVAWADKQKITWERADEERIDHMRVGLAVMDHKNISKYTPFFNSQKARKIAQNLAKLGRPYDEAAVAAAMG